MQLARPTTALAMIGLGQVGQLEVGGKRLCNPVGGFEIEAADCGPGLLQQDHFFAGRVGLAFAMLDQQPPQTFYRVEQFRPSLLNQNATQQDAQRANIAAQRSFFVWHR